VKKSAFFLLLSTLLFVSCGKTCRCYRYDGNVDEFEMSELTEKDMSCDGMEDYNFGLTYSLCERVLN